MGFGLPELIVILVIIILLFGATQLPKLARSMGQASKEFKRGADSGTLAVEDSPQVAASEGTESPSGGANSQAEGTAQATSWPGPAERPPDKPL